jgi:hypothetical protein
MDIRLQNGRPMVLDVNANPDLDPTSVFPTAAETTGLDYAAMAMHIAKLAAIRMRRRLSAIKARRNADRKDERGQTPEHIASLIRVYS